MEAPAPAFFAYIALLILSGALTLAIALLPVPQHPLARVVGAAFGIGFLGYAVYLIFFFHGGTFALFFWAFIVPFMSIVHAVKAYGRRRRQLSPTRVDTLG
ncbi:MAG: hypothetical protein J2O46_02110 [Nocardioides sp.]|nr:hypothetical protein [Nocardioides sp.]